MAEELHRLDHKSALFAATAAHQMDKNIEELEWLKNGLKNSTKSDFESVIDGLKINDLVINNTLRETLSLGLTNNLFNELQTNS